MVGNIETGDLYSSKSLDTQSCTDEEGLDSIDPKTTLTLLDIQSLTFILGRQHKDTNFGDFQDNSRHFCNKCMIASLLATNYYNYSRDSTFGHGTNSMSNSDM